MPTPYADLHVHSCYSDGQLTPEAIVQEADERGLRAIAVTDHDTIAAWPETRRAASASDVAVITGVELSVSCEGQEIHLLGYGFDPSHDALCQHLNDFLEARRQRVRRIVDKLREKGIGISVEEVRQVAGGSKSLGRPHVAAALAEAGHVASYTEAFDRYLENGGPAYVGKPEFEAACALDLVHDAGGIGVLAHPGHWMSDRLLRQLVHVGLDGIEVVHPSHNEPLTRYYRRIARDFDLVPTGGSDYHGFRPGDEERFGTYGISHAEWKRIRQGAAPER